ncbi:hypothetical protein Dsin_014658 [Dipteronia sinensis]|uniref:Uncharacterized protein n=1 Tax=Dipteronia sinensis TaxID=43782 RepID=A0AAE0EA12_9ROSI|nr:hypothetical protein Dsin_014658 [Dipteronia sinensis]
MTRNAELRAIIDGVPNNVAPAPLIPVLNDEQNADEANPSPLENNINQGSGYNVAQTTHAEANQPDSQTQQEVPPAPVPIVDQRQENVLKTPVSLQSTQNLVTGDSGLHLFADPELSRRKFNFPNMKQFKGTTDPEEHIAYYKQRMFTATIPRDLREACMCKEPGLAMLVVAEFLSRVEEIGRSIGVSIYEISQDHVYDLLDPK